MASASGKALDLTGAGDVKLEATGDVANKIVLSAGHYYKGARVRLLVDFKRL